jgi:hypothetical protein
MRLREQIYADVEEPRVRTQKKHESRQKGFTGGSSYVNSSSK